MKASGNNGTRNHTTIYGCDKFIREILTVLVMKHFIFYIGRSMCRWSMGSEWILGRLAGGRRVE
jgi:hypothetical protein